MTPLIAAAMLGGSGASRAADCSVTSVGFIPLSDLGTELYLNQFEGGLYPGGSNEPPPTHALEGRTRATSIVPLDRAGDPDEGGKIVLLSIGMSNAALEFCSSHGNPPCNPWTFVGQATLDPRVNEETLVFANGARGGEPADAWDSPDEANYVRVKTAVLRPLGLTEEQVQIVWIKLADPGPTVSLPNASADAYVLKKNLGNVVRAVRSRYANIRIAFISNRIYAGYAGYPVPQYLTSPEPYAYETGFAVKWLIEAQINQMSGGGIDPSADDLDYTTVAPWLAWGPDLWSDGLIPRSDGLRYLCSDISSDGTHPKLGAQQKVGKLLREFMLSSPFATPWFRDCELGDMNVDRTVDGLDIALFVQTIIEPLSAPAPLHCAADCSDDGIVSFEDVQAFAQLLLEP